MESNLTVKSKPIYKKPAFRIILAAILCCVAVAVCLLTIPKKDKTPETEQSTAKPEPTPLPASSPEVVNMSSVKDLQWLDYYESANDMPWDSTKEITLDTFPNVTFRWTAGSVKAIEGDRTRTLFSGMPVWSVYLKDLTGDGKPELIATVSFGSGIVDEHVVVYDYVSKQSYTLWDRMQFDFHLYTVDGALYVSKTPYMGDRQVDSGTLELHDGVLSCRWQSDGSYTLLSRMLHESELIGEWLVEEERDSDGNVLYTNSVELWKEYNFREDGTAVYNETVPISSDSELAFGHPKDYSYEVHDDCVYIDKDNTSEFFRMGMYDGETGKLTLWYITPNGSVDATLKRMGEPENSNGLSKEQADAFVSGLSVEFEDGNRFGCDLVCYLDGYGTCYNVGDKDAWKAASLRFERLETGIVKLHYENVQYKTYLSAGGQSHLVGLLVVTESGYFFNPYPSEQNLELYSESIDFSAVDFDPKQVGVIRSFDAEKREITVSFGKYIEPHDDFFGGLDYGSISEEQTTLRITDDTVLTLLPAVSIAYESLVKPDRFFRFVTEHTYYIHHGGDTLFDDDRGIAFFIGCDGDTLRYLRQIYEP